MRSGGGEGGPAESRGETEGQAGWPANRTSTIMGGTVCKVKLCNGVKLAELPTSLKSGEGGGGVVTRGEGD